MNLADGQNDFRGGMIASVDASRIGPTSYAFGRNGVIREGAFKTRPGSVRMEYSSAAEALVGFGVFRTVAGIADIDKVLVVTYNDSGVTSPWTVYAYQHPVGWQFVPTPADVGKRDGLSFVQHNGAIYLLRGLGSSTWKWDGTSAAGFAAVESPAVGDPVPEADFGMSAYNRLWLICEGGELLLASDLLSDAFDYIEHSYQIDPYTGGRMVALHEFENGGLLVFKERSIHLLHGANGDLSDITQRVLDSRHGCAAPRTVVQVGADVWYLSTDGVRGVLLGEDNVGRAIDLPISEPIRLEYWESRINMAAIETAVAVVFDNYYMLAVPTANSTYPDTVLVFDLTVRAWVGEWSMTTDTAPFAGLAVITSSGKELLLGIEPTGSIDQLCAGMYHDIAPSANATAFYSRLTAKPDPCYVDLSYAKALVYARTAGGVSFELRYANQFGLTPADVVTCCLHMVDGAATWLFHFEVTIDGPATGLYAQVQDVGLTMQWEMSLGYPLLKSVNDGMWHTFALLADGVNPVGFYIDGELQAADGDLWPNPAAWFADMGAEPVAVHFGCPPGTLSSPTASALVRRLSVFDYSGGVLVPVLVVPLDEGEGTVAHGHAVPPYPDAGYDFPLKPTGEVGFWYDTSADVQPIPLRIKTRAMMFETPGVEKAVKNAELTVRHRGLNLSVSANTEDPFTDVALVTTKQYTMGKSELHGEDDWDGSLADLCRKGFADYGPVAWPTALGDAAIPGDGVPLDREAEHSLLMSPSLRGRSCQFDVENETGTASIEAVAVTATQVAWPSKSRR